MASFTAVFGAPVGIAIASFSLAFSMSTGIIKKLLETTQNKKKKHNKIVMLAIGKLNSIESKIFTKIINEEKNYRELKALKWCEIILKKLI